MAQTSSSYSIMLTNNGAGVLTPTVIRNPTTVPAGGTAVALPWVENTNGGAGSAGVTSTLLPGVAVQAAFRGIADDISAGN